MSLPRFIIWEVTYACPLRCLHCYTESGRRAARHPADATLLEIARAIARLRPRRVLISGGEPLLVSELLRAVECLSPAPVTLYTSGWKLERELAREVARVFHRVCVSVDAGVPELHDRVRGRQGSFERCMIALSLLSELLMSGECRENFDFGIDATVLNSTVASVDRLCGDLAHRFPGLAFVSVGPAVPSGLASREGVVDEELLDMDGFVSFTDPARVSRWRARLPAGVQLWVTDNLGLRMGPDAAETDPLQFQMHVEPDGAIKALPMYEGTVGSLLVEDPEILWERCVQRRSDPFVVEQLSRAHSVQGWAAAARAIDHHFASPADLVRLQRRQPFSG